MSSLNEVPAELIEHIITLLKPRITEERDLWRVALVNKKFYRAYLKVKHLFKHRLTRARIYIIIWLIITIFLINIGATFDSFKSDIAAIIMTEQDPKQLHLLLTEHFARFVFPIFDHVTNSRKYACRRCKEYPITVFAGSSDVLIWCPRKNLFLTKYTPKRAHAYGWEWEGAKRLSSYSILNTRGAIQWLCSNRLVIAEYMNRQ